MHTSIGKKARTHRDGDPLPLLDSVVLNRLRSELDDDERVWKVFVQNFITHLPERNERLRQALTTGDFKDAMAAVLSLKTSCQMVGAERLAGLAMDLEQSLRDEAGNAEAHAALPQLAVAHLARIRQSSRQTTYILQVNVQQEPPKLT
jgi:HPt (histidine-containing phosphotransfer) domain-containing protein